MTDWPATVAPKWAIASNHAAAVEEDAIRQASVVPTGGQAGRWQAITDTTTIVSSLVDLKEKGATPQDRRFLYVDCISRTTAALGVGVEIIELDHLLNHLVTFFVAQVEQAASVDSGAGIAVGNTDVVRLFAPNSSGGRSKFELHRCLLRFVSGLRVVGPETHTHMPVRGINHLLALWRNTRVGATVVKTHTNVPVGDA